MKKFNTLFFLLLGLALCTPLFCGSKEVSVTTAKPIEGKVYPIAIIGAGAGGTMAVKRAVLNNREALLFTGAKKEMKRSRGSWVRKVENVPGLEKYNRAIVELRDEALKDLLQGPLRHNLFVIKDSVTSLTKKDKFFELVDKSGRTYLARYVILATGMMDEQPHINGSIKPILGYANNQSIAYCLMCDGHRSFQKKTVVIGYSDDAAKSAILLKRRYNPSQVTLLTNGHKTSFSQETAKLLASNNIQVIEAPITNILGQKKDKHLSGFQFKSGNEIAADIGFVMLGIRPNNALASSVGANLDPRGLVLTNQQGESSVPNLFIVGDLRANSLKQIYTAWQNAVDVVQVIDGRIRTEQN